MNLPPSDEDRDNPITQISGKWLEARYMGVFSKKDLISTKSSKFMELPRL